MEIIAGCVVSARLMAASRLAPHLAATLHRCPVSSPQWEQQTLPVALLSRSPGLQLLETPLGSRRSRPWKSPCCVTSPNSPFFFFSFFFFLHLETRVKVTNGKFDIRADVLPWSTLSAQNNRFAGAVTPNKECSHIPRETSSSQTFPKETRTFVRFYRC